VDDYIVELDYTVVQANTYTVTLDRSRFNSREAMVLEAERRLRKEIASELEPFDHPTILRRYVEPIPSRPLRLVIPPERLALLD